LPLPDVPPDERKLARTEYVDAGGDASTSDLAALALGWLRSEKARPSLTKPESDPFQRLALALLGDAGRLREEDFQSKDDLLRDGAVEVVVRAKGRVGLAWAVSGSGGESSRIAARLRATLLAENAPGREELEKATSLPDLRTWFESYSSEYLARFKK